MAPTRAIPPTCATTREHDWVRLEGDEAVFGITWYAQDALGEVVYYDPPAVGGDGEQGRALRRARVGQGGLGHLRAGRAARSGGERGGGRHARARERGPLRRGLADAGAAVRPGRARRPDGRAPPTAPTWRACEHVHLPHRRRPPRDARGDRRRLDRRALRRHPRGGAAAAGRSTCRRGCPSRRCSPTCASSPPATPAPTTRSRSSAPACTTTTSRRSIDSILPRSSS